MSRQLMATLLVCQLLSARQLVAQTPSAFELSAGAAATRFRSTVPGSAGASSGIAAGGEGRVFAGHLSLRAWYFQGRLSPDTGATPTSDLAEAGLMVALQPAPWMTLAAGPRLRAYVLPTNTERWVLWEGRARFEKEIVGALLRAHVELRTAFSSSVNSQPAKGARGGEAGITGRLPGSRFWARLTYAIDHAELKAGGAETLDGISLAVGFGGH